MATVQPCGMNQQRHRQWIKATPGAVGDALTGAGIFVDPADIMVLQRDDRFAAVLPGDRMAWFPINEGGLARLAREARVLRLLTQHCCFRVPIIDHEASDGWQVRRSVPGACDPVATYRRAIADRGFATALGSSIGAMLASQHRAIASADLTGWLPGKPSWPPPRPEIERDLQLVIDDASLLDRALQVVELYEREVDAADPVLVHSDLGFHNMVVDQTSGSLVGVFDYDDAAFADRHHDFKYLLLDVAEEVLLQSATSAYRAAGGKPIDIGRCGLLNAASAVGFLALHAGHGPEERPAGRTLDDDLRWTRLALARAEGDGPV